MLAACQLYSSGSGRGSYLRFSASSSCCSISNGIDTLKDVSEISKEVCVSAR